MKTHFLSLVLAGVILALAGCKRHEEGKRGEMPPAPVTVAKPERTEVVEWDEYTGRLEAKEMVEIRPRVSGWLESIHFAEGKDVKAGDLLFKIDPRPYRAAAERVEAEYERAQNREKQMKNELGRVKGLVGTKAVSEEDYDTREKSVAEASAAARAAKAALDVAKLDLEFTEVRSPIDGKISRALVTKGNLVTAGMNGSGSTLLTTVVSTAPLYLYVDVDEEASLKYRRLFAAGKAAGKIDAHLPCWMALGDEKGWPHEGYIDFVDNRVDPATGTIRARGVFDKNGVELAPGFFARLRIPGSEKHEVLLVPEDAIGSDQAMKFVYVADAQGRAQRKPVKLGAKIEGKRVVREGLTGDEDVVVNGQARIMFAGAPLKIEALKPGGLPAEKMERL
jgi:RND family efflux transporter MFP subunit